MIFSVIFGALVAAQAALAEPIDKRACGDWTFTLYSNSGCDADPLPGGGSGDSDCKLTGDGPNLGVVFEDGARRCQASFFSDSACSNKIAGPSYAPGCVTSGTNDAPTYYSVDCSCPG